MPKTSTSNLDGARAHARSQAAASAAALPPQGLVWAETLEVGNYATKRLRRGSVVRITDTDGDGCVQLLVYNAAAPSERLNVADTVKVQWQAYLGAEALLLSDMGRTLMTIVADTSSRHDALCGCSNRRANQARFGSSGVESASPNARDLLTLGAAKHGLSRVDVGPNINLFKTVRVDDDGRLHFDGVEAPGTQVDLRAEMDVIVVLSNTPHPLDPRANYTGSAVHISAWNASPPTDDSFRTTSPERERAFQNTDAFLAGVNQ